MLHRLEEVPLEVLRQRESKWLDMLNNWDKWMAKKHKKVRGLALGLGLGVGSLGKKRKREDLYQLRGAGASPTASILECPHLPALKREQKLVGGQGLVFTWSSKMTSDSHRTLSWSQTSKLLLAKSP